MSKYDALSRHLAERKDQRWDATFEEIETILGFQLPESARCFNAWWANQSGSGHSQSKAWQSVGWRTENVRPRESRVSFVRERQPTTPPTFFPSKVQCDDLVPERGLTIADAKAGLSVNYGVPVEQIEILIKG